MPRLPPDCESLLTLVKTCSRINFKNSAKRVLFCCRCCPFFRMIPEHIQVINRLLSKRLLTVRLLRSAM